MFAVFAMIFGLWSSGLWHRIHRQDYMHDFVTHENTVWIDLTSVIVLDCGTSVAVAITD
jgi:hypothetical protein